MKKLGFHWLLGAALIGSSAFQARSQTNSAPDFKEVYDLVRAHLSGISEAELNQAATKGLIMALAPKVSLVPKDATEGTEADGALVTRSNLFDGKIGYVRVGRVEPDLAKAVRTAYGDLDN